MRHQTCAICTLDFSPPCFVSELACHPKHIMHKDCLEDWINHNKSKGKTAICPICRVEIDESKIKKREITHESDQHTPDPFAGLANKAQTDKLNNAENTVVHPI
mmetsp:Transcript_9131/g.6487  ORF Transcript_9131/g.6487 Transcript_9131/m.6487 type:complete len:104 (-) Transcript_9131:235-546(-)